MHESNRLSSVMVGCAVVMFHAIFAAIALAPGTRPSSRWWYWLGSLTYPLYLVYNRIGKVIWANLVPAHSELSSLTLQLVFSLTISAVIAAAVERRAVNFIHNALFQAGVGFVSYGRRGLDCLSRDRRSFRTLSMNTAATPRKKATRCALDHYSI